MKHFITSLLLTSLLTLAGCQQPSSSTLSPQLAQVESIMNEHPDSALRLLQGITPPADELNRATWALFTTQARYKLFMTQSDSLLNTAFPYFMEKGDAQRRAMVLYYRAALYREENKMEEAQEYYLKAKDEVDLLDDYFLKYLIYAELGHIYARTLPDYGMEYYTKALNFAQSSGIPKQLSLSCIISSYIDIARMYSQKKEYQQALTFYKKAVDTAQNNKDYSKQMAALKEMATIYRKNNDFQSALDCMQKTYQIANSHSIKWSYAKFLTLGRIYTELNQLDSAANNLNKALLSSDIYTKAGAYSSLFHIYKTKGEHKEAISHLEQAWILQDSIAKIEKSQALIEMQEKYDQQQVINEKNELEIKKNQTILKVLVCLVAAIITIAILIFFYQKKLLAKERQIKVAERAVNKKAIQIAENENTISRNEARILALSEEIGKNKGQQETLQEQKEALEKIKKQNYQLEQKNIVLKQDINTIQQNLEQKSKEIKRLQFLSEENLYLRQRELFLSDLLVQKNKLLNNLTAKPQYIETEEWASIIREVDYLFDDYTQRLSKRIPSLTESDIQICCLIKLHISNPTIAILLAISSTSVTKRKVRLKERILQAVGTLGDSQSLEIWLWEF